MLEDEELISICEAEINDIDSESDLSAERTRSMDFYMGEMGDYLSAGEDRSNVVTRDVMDTVESVLPSLIKIFVDADNAVEFVPTEADDEIQAKLETDAVRTVFYEQNDGFLTLYSFFKDALISGTGILKSWWEEGAWEREEYVGLNPLEAQKILMDTREYELIEATETDEGVDLIIKVKHPGKVKIDVIPPEEFGVSRNANSPDPKKATFSYHKAQKTVSDLIEMGFDREIVEAIPTDDTWDNEERLARRNRSDEQDYDNASHVSMRMVWVSECYINIDRDNDGIAELLKVTLGSVGAGSKLLHVEEVDENPFVCITPIILTHKFYGFSLGDTVEDIQEIRTVLFRGILDNMYLANNGRMGANEKVNLDDLLVSRPGGIVRTEGVDPPGNHISPIVNQPIPAQSFGLLEVLDGMIKARTGIGDEVAGLDAKALSNVSPMAIAQAYDSARMRIELMARIFAELGVKNLFKDIHRLLHKNQDQSVQMRIKDVWMDVSPTHWRDTRDMKVAVGLGHQTREKKLMAIQDIQGLQEKAFQFGYDYVTPQNIHQAISDRIEAHGMDVNKYFQNPATYQPQQKPPPFDQEIQKAELQLKGQAMELDKQRVQVESQVKILLAQSREREMETKRKMEELSGMVQIERTKVDEQNQVMRAVTDKDRAEFEKAMGIRQQEWKEVSGAFELRLEKQSQEIEKQKAMLDSATDLETKSMDIAQKENADVMRHIQQMTQMMQNAQNDRDERHGKIMDWISKNGSDRVKEIANQL